jgi:hypothetical protein
VNRGEAALFIFIAFIVAICGCHFQQSFCKTSRFQVLTASSTKVKAFWDNSLMMEAVCTSETWANFYETTLCTSQKAIVFNF